MIVLLPIIRNWIKDPYFEDDSSDINKKIDVLNENMTKLLTFRITESNYTTLNNIFKLKVTMIKYIIKIFKKMYKLFNEIIWIPRCNRVKEWKDNRKREITDANYIDN